MPHFSTGCYRQIPAMTKQIPTALLMNDSSRVGGSESSSMYECTERVRCCGNMDPPSHPWCGSDSCVADITLVET